MSAGRGADVEMHPIAREVAMVLAPVDGAIEQQDLSKLHRLLASVEPNEIELVATHLIALAIRADRLWGEAARPIVEAIACLVVRMIRDPALLQSPALDKIAARALGSITEVRARPRELVEKPVIPQLRLLRGRDYG